MVFDSKVILDWPGKHQEWRSDVAIGKVASSLIHPNPILDTDNLFGPWLGEEEYKPNPRPRAIMGDNLAVMSWLLSSGYSGKIDLIYIDPPYLSQSNYHSRILLVDGTRKEWLQRRVFQDDGNPGMSTYLDGLYKRFILMRELLAENGSIFVHLDWHACHYVKILLDEIFGNNHFINEIIWCYSGGSGTRRHFHRKHDTILWYSKGEKYTFNPQFRSYSEATLQRGLTRVKGDRFQLHEEGAMLQDWWADINKILSPTAYENLKFPTQKPVALLRRLIECASNPGDLVADFYAGSGTLAEAAETSGRDWINCDNNDIALGTTLYRLIEMKSRDFRLDTFEIDSPVDDQPRLKLYGPYVRNESRESLWLEIGIEDYSPARDDRARLENPWPWSVLLDFWEIDTDYQEGFFHSNWQVIRQQHRCYDSNIPTRVRIPLPGGTSGSIAVRIHDIFGRETIRSVEVK
ncbi:MAG: site-specific DNA-methyltransferase [Syntrophomonadaceae bacterium]|nr:site-specific DNA-methyltransferase [Syntrophomonadaceae bacterium]